MAGEISNLKAELRRIEEWLGTHDPEWYHKGAARSSNPEVLRERREQREELIKEIAALDREDRAVGPVSRDHRVVCPMCRKRGKGDEIPWRYAHLFTKEDGSFMGTYPACDVHRILFDGAHSYSDYVFFTRRRHAPSLEHFSEKALKAASKRVEYMRMTAPRWSCSAK